MTFPISHKTLITTGLLAAGAMTAQAQSVTGTVIDAETRMPLAEVVVKEGNTTNNALTDKDGRFTLKVSTNHPIISIERLGYEPVQRKPSVKGSGTASIGTVELEYDLVNMEGVTVTSQLGLARQTPVALSNVSGVYIEDKLGAQEFPEVLKTTPGVYASKHSGGYGDSKLNMRGFQSANVAVIVNGVPMNDMEWGGVYWSNWAGLGDVTRYIQTQRGLGASKVAAPSVGGTVNIVTKTTDSKRGGSVSYGVGNDGLNTMTLALSSGMNKNGWGFSMLLGKKWGDGYVQGTDFEAYNYFLSIFKRINERHQLSLTGFGAPQEHYQRNQYDGLKIGEWQKVRNYMNGKSPYRYNPTYGFGKNGERKSSSYNYYHKPQFSLNHLWDIDAKSSLSTALYVSIGNGYGNSGQGINSTYGNNWYGASNGVLSNTFRNADGTFAYDKVQELNEQSEQGSLMVMSESRNEHTWYGLLSTYTRELSEKFNVYGGIDIRSYKGVHTNVISDLYNGEYYTDVRYRSTVNPAHNARANDHTWVYEKLGVGDVVNRDYDSHIEQQGVFAQLEYGEKEKLSAFISGSLSNSTYWRYDRLYYDEAHAESETVNYWGGNIKGGANYNIDRHHNVFANVGYISRAPFFSGGVFLMSQNSNEINRDAVNEKAFSAELGYGFHNDWMAASVNAYYTLWMDKTATRSSYIGNTGDWYIMNMDGVDARHMGVEVDITAKPAPWVTVKGMLSLGNWKWSSNATAYFYNSTNQPLADLSKGTIASGAGAADHAKLTLNQDGVHVGGSPQTTASIGADFHPLKGLTVGAEYIHFARNYADYAMPTSGGNGEITLREPWKIPSAGQLDLSARYNFKLGTCDASIIANVQNVFDYEYITDAFYDGTNNSWEDAYRVFYSFGRTYAVKMKVSF